MATEPLIIQKDNRPQSKEERPTYYKLPDFLSELTRLIRDRMNSQNSKIERMRSDLNLRQGEIDQMKKRINELSQKVEILEKKVNNQRPEIDGRILDNLRKA